MKKILYYAALLFAGTFLKVCIEEGGISAKQK